MKALVVWACTLAVGWTALAQEPSKRAVVWQMADLANLQDDDLARHAGDASYLDELSVQEARFSESGFDWHLIRFANSEKPIGPLWAVPHDDENASFDAAIEAVKIYGGTVIAVNSGPDSERYQKGRGTCGERSGIVARCDPNRNFSESTPLFSKAHMDILEAGQPIIALHTNSPGFGPGRGNITILDTARAAKGINRPRVDGHFGINQPEQLKDYDSFAIMPYRTTMLRNLDVQCRTAMVERGVHVWHETVKTSDGSFSNYVELVWPGLRYVNMESRRETDLVIAAKRHRLMIAAYMAGCINSGN
jgi:hypothetical protein